MPSKIHRMQLENKPQGYFEHKRPEMLAFIDIPVKKVLDLGCGYGSYLNLLSEKFPGIETWGLEIDPVAGETAASFGHKIFVGNAEELIDQIPDDYFDLISCNDVLEHFLNPYLILEKLRKKLKNGGRIISSMPNIRYYKAMASYLFDKEWKYEEAGVMDKTHFRFFTQKSIERMYKDAGFKVLKNVGINQGKSSKPAIVNALTFGKMFDIRFPQIATVATK